MTPPPPPASFELWALKRNEIWKDKLKELLLQIKKQEDERIEDGERTILYKISV